MTNWIRSNKTEAKVVETRLRRLSDNERLLFVASDANFSTLFATTANVQLDSHQLTQFLNDTINPYITSMKKLHNRARPFQLNNFVREHRIQSHTVHTPSYPSGHSMQSLFLALELARLYPTKKKELIDLAEQIGQSRIAAGHHYPTDHEYGKELAVIFSDKFKYELLHYL